METDMKKFEIKVQEGKHPREIKKENALKKAGKKGKSPEYLLANQIFLEVLVGQNTILCPKDLEIEKLNPATIITYLRRLSEAEGITETKKFKYKTLNPDELFEEEKQYQFFRIK